MATACNIELKEGSDPFSLPKDLNVQAFRSLGRNSGSRAILLTVFLTERPHTDEVTLSTMYKLSGCARAYTVLSGTVPIGFLFATYASAETLVSDCRLSVKLHGDCTYEPTFTLARSGLVVAVGSNSSVVIVSSAPKSLFLITVDANDGKDNGG